MAPKDSGSQQDVRQESAKLSLADFLETIPPSQLLDVSDLATTRHHPEKNASFDEVCTPDLQLHCTSDACNGTRFFRCTNPAKTPLVATYLVTFYLMYQCSNCQRTRKTFSLAAKLDAEHSATGQVCKFGELPPFGPPTPSRLISLIGPDRDEFLNGRRCENLGLGVGAFIYYRRVVENQKGRILNEIIKVAEKIGPEAGALRTLRDAVQETQFSKALTMTKDAIPQSLLINGQNPLLLLHGALSEGVDGLSDKECLEIASSVRVLLAELSERLAQALKDEVELSKALSTLMTRIVKG